MPSTKTPRKPIMMNEARAFWAHSAIVRFQQETGTDDEDALGDLLADLMHWCDAAGKSFDAELDTAKMHYLTEIREDKDTPYKY